VRKRFLLIFTALVITFLYAACATHGKGDAADNGTKHIINAATTDPKTHSQLSQLNGHVAINISTGDREFDAQFAEGLQEAYPNFISSDEAVSSEDLYQMAVKVYRENRDTVVQITVTDFEQKKVVEQTVTVQNVSPHLLEILQYETDAIARSEIESYLDAVFSNAGAVVQEVRIAPANMVRINGGTFTMGSPASEPNRGSNETQHRVTVSGFSMGKYEVTQEEYEAVMGNNPSNFKGSKLPVECVSWYDAVEYCNRQSRKEGLTPAYTINGTNVTWNRSANGYRLPTEAEWEYACRAGTTTAYNTGASISDSTGWYWDNSGRKTHEVGKKPANAWGLYDMHGNVYEWCWDWYGDYDRGSQMDPAGRSSGSYRVFRGGSWNGKAWGLRSALRYVSSPSVWISTHGFRLVRP
jgi:formylglycine-generating enzyme required for sulfatase activity